MSDDAADLALLDAVGGPPVRVAPLNDYQAVCLFLDQHGVSKGVHRGVEVCTLYRLYLAWFEGQDGLIKVRPFSFAKQLRRIGYQKRHDGREREGKKRGKGGSAKVDRDAMVLLVNRPGAAFLRNWRDNHPDTPEYRKWFRGYFARDKRIIT